jgi:hypothetical protein
MSTQIQRRKGTTAEHSTFTGAEAELTVDTTKDTVVVHDGATTGGRPLLREDQANLPTSVTNGISVPSANNVAISTNGTGRLFVDASGNVSIGTATAHQALDIGGTTSALVKFTPSNYGTGATDGAQIGISFGGLDVWQFENNYVRFGTANTERARIDSSGRLLVGTSTSLGLNATLQVANDNTNDHIELFRGSNSATDAPAIRIYKSRGSIASPTEVLSGDTLGYLIFRGYDGSSFRDAAWITAIADGTWTDGGDTTDNPGALVFSTTADGASSPTERMRITSGGAVLIGTTTTSELSDNGLSINTGAACIYKADGSANHDFLDFYRGTSGSYVRVGNIRTDGSSTAYNTSSDYRLKENVVPLTGAADRLNQLQVHRFNFIAYPDKTVDGFIAHEAQAVVPECVTGIKDEVDDDGNPVYQGIDQSKLVPLLTAALQEALAEIESLKDRVTALEP